MATVKVVDADVLDTKLTAIADAIRQRINGSEKLTLDQMTDAIKSMRYIYRTGTIASTVIGTNAYAVLAKAPIIAEIKTDANLTADVRFDAPVQENTIVRVIANNNNGNSNWNGMVNKYGQQSLRYNGSAARDDNSCERALNEDFAGDASTMVGYLSIVDDELRIYSRSSNYAIRPSTYTVTLTW